MKQREAKGIVKQRASHKRKVLRQQKIKWAIVKNLYNSVVAILKSDLVRMLYAKVLNR